MTKKLIDHYSKTHGHSEGERLRHALQHPDKLPKPTPETLEELQREYAKYSHPDKNKHLAYNTAKTLKTMLISTQLSHHIETAIITIISRQLQHNKEFQEALSK